MTSILVCRHCGFETQPYDMHIGGGYLEAFESAKEHIKKKHKPQWKYWLTRGSVIQECFKVR